MPLVTIPETSVEGSVVYYQINLRLPLRSITVHKRYSDFVDLVNTLCKELGITANEFPYPLPPKGTMFSNKSKLILERQSRLVSFLASVIKDRDLQNRRSIHRFLQLPQNYKFTPALFKETVGDTDKQFIIDDDDSAIDKAQWLSYLRMVRFNVTELSKDKNLAARLESRERINHFIRPNVGKLASSLAHLSKSGAIDQNELHQRTTMLKEVQAEIEGILDSKVELFEEKKGNGTTSRRVFAKSSNKPTETKETIALDNAELLQQQKQVHKEQDKELELLRMIIARQRQIGETINREVEEQNELLDRFSSEVDASSDKVKLARARARKIG